MATKYEVPRRQVPVVRTSEEELAIAAWGRPEQGGRPDVFNKASHLYFSFPEQGRRYPTPPEQQALIEQLWNAGFFSRNGTATDLFHSPNGKDGTNQELGVPIDFTSGKNDKTLLGLIESNLHLPLEGRVQLANRLAEAVFTKDEEGRLNEHRIGPFLETATALYKKEDTPDELGQTFYDFLDKDRLKEIARESSRQRWAMENAEASLHADCTFLSIDRLFEDQPEEAAAIKTDIAQDMTFARSYDLASEQAALRQAVSPGIQMIDLPTQGEEVAQCGVKRALQYSADTLGIKERILGFYRSRLLVMGDPTRGYMTPEQVLAELMRVEGAPRGPGVELACLGGTVDTDGEIRIYPGVANVSGNLLPAVGSAQALRQHAIEKEGITFERPERSDTYRHIQLEDPTDVMVVAFGDGSWNHLFHMLEIAESTRAPLIALCTNNDIAIGTPLSEGLADPEIWKKGHSAGTPGIRIGMTDIDGIFLATRWATERAALDAGPTVIEVMTDRAAAHSSSHSNQLVAGLIIQGQEILQDQLHQTQEDDPNYQEIEKFKNDGIFASTRTDRKTNLRARLRSFVERGVLDTDHTGHLSELAESIIDPMEVVMNNWQQEGTITPQQVAQWQEESRREMNRIYEELASRARPDKELVGKHVRIPGPYIIVKGREEDRILDPNRELVEVEYSNEIMKMTGAQTQSLTLAERMRANNRLVVAGVDVNIGYEVKNENNKYKIEHKGGYVKGTSDLWVEFGHQPGRIWNLPITENANLQRFMGYVTQLANNETRNGEIAQQGNHVVMDMQYGDYGIEAWQGWWVLGGITQTTNGQIIRPIGTILPCSMTGGGGGMHSNNVEAAAYQVPEGVDIFTVSHPREFRGLMNYEIPYGQNPYIIVPDRGMYLRTYEWERGTDIFEPGRDNLIQDGTDLQVITWGPMTKVVKQAVKQTQDTIGEDASIGILEKISWRPKDSYDLEKYLRQGRGNIVVATEDFLSRSLGNQLITALVTNPRLRPHVIGRNIQFLGSTDSSHPYCDEILMEQQRFDASELTEVFTDALMTQAKQLQE